MRRTGPVALVVVLLASSFAGCLAPDPGSGDPTAAESGSGEGPPPAPQRPWRESWRPVATNVTVDYRPEEPHLSAQASLTVRNDLGRDRQHLVAFMGRYQVTEVTDEDGDALDYTTTDLPRPLEVLPEEVRDAVLPGFQLINVTLDGDVSHGAERTIHLRYEGWATSFMSTSSGLPNDAAMNTHFGIVPVAGDNGTAEMGLTIRSPSDWTVLASATPVQEETEGDRQVTSYRGEGAFMAVTSGKGLLRRTATVNGTEVVTYYFPDMREQSKVVHEVTKRTLRVMPDLVGDYPYDHLWTVPNQFPANAFSTPGLTFLGLSFYRSSLSDVPVQFGRLTPYAAGDDAFEMVVVHEHTHNWFGHNVEGNNSDPDDGPLDAWVSEGITTYLSELVWWEVTEGEREAEWSSHGKVADQKTWSRAIYRHHPDETLEERGAAEPGGDYYEKAALALRALQAYATATNRSGAVLEALHRTQAEEGLAAGGDGSVGTREIFGVFEETFGEDLDWHVDAWFLGSALPDLTVAGVSDGDEVAVTVENAGDVRSAALVEVTTNTGRELSAWTVVDAGDESEVVLAKPSGAGDEPVVAVEVDPLQHVYETDEKNNAWPRT